VVNNEDKKKFIDQDAEDALKLNTLYMLTTGPNSHLSKTALKIIAQRACTGETYRVLLIDLASRHEQKRLRALRALSFLSKSPFLYKLNTPQTFRALVENLTYYVSPRYNPPLSHMIRPGEKRAIEVMNRLISYNPSDAIAAGIVSKFLCRYRFGRTTKEVREAIHDLKAWDPKEPDMAGIYHALMATSEGCRQLRAAGLLEFNEESDHDEPMFDVDATVGRSLAVAPERRQRPIESREQQSLRRRRREAMVLSDGAEPFGSQDIIQRMDSLRSQRENNHGTDWSEYLDGWSDFWSRSETVEPVEPVEPIDL
jgi:preprotein translocase subunit Sec61beta